MPVPFPSAEKKLSSATHFAHTVLFDSNNFVLHLQIDRPVDQNEDLLMWELLKQLLKIHRHQTHVRAL
ncbi:hypothetical protein Dimus_019239 [Dionaea muscipula]